MGLILDGDEAKRKLTIYHQDGNKRHIETRQDCSHIVEAAKVLAEVPPDPETGWRFVCAIPDAVYNQACIEGWLHDKARWRKWASDPDNRDFNGGRSNPF